MLDQEIVELDIPVWDGWYIFAAKLNADGWAKLFLRKGENTLLGKMRPDPPSLVLPEELGEYTKEAELTLIKTVLNAVSSKIEAMQKACLNIMHENIEALLISSAMDDNPSIAQHLEEVLKTLYENNPEVLAYMALSDKYPLSVRAVPARLFGLLARVQIEKEALLLTRLLSHPEKAIQEATLQGVSG